jgi:thioesterase domain-containing protein
MENPAPRNVTIPGLAETYIGSMKKIQPQGPYYICGWSLGGAIAVEMARQLEQVNQAVGFLALIDAPAPPKTPRKKEMEFTVQSESEWIQRYLGESEISQALKNAVGIDQLWTDVVDYLVARPGHFDLEAIQKLIPQGMAQVIPNFQHLEIKELIYYLNRIRTLDNARNKYTPGVKMNIAVYFFAADRSIVSTGGGWSGHFKSPLKIHKINGDHFTIFKVPEVIKFARKFDRALHEAQNPVT